MNIGALLLHPFRHTKWCKAIIRRRCNKHFEYERANSQQQRDERVSLGMYRLEFGNGMRWAHSRPGKTALPLDIRMPWTSRMWMTDQEINRYLNEYGDKSFENLPAWLRQELAARNLTWPKRQPTSDEFLESMEDARIHRVTNDELTINDLEDYYERGKRSALRPF
jgi:hypothetical protein